MSKYLIPNSTESQDKQVPIWWQRGGKVYQKDKKLKWNYRKGLKPPITLNPTLVVGSNVLG